MKTVKSIFLTIIVIAHIMLISCNENNSQDSIMPSTQTIISTASINDSVQEFDKIIDVYQAVLQNKERFYSINASYLSIAPDIEDFYYLSEFGDYIDSEYFKVTVFSVLDMDGDGIP